MFRLMAGAPAANAAPPHCVVDLRTFALRAGSRARSPRMYSQARVHNGGGKSIRYIPPARAHSTCAPAQSNCTPAQSTCTSGHEKPRRWHTMAAYGQLVQANARFGAYQILVLHHNYSR